MSSFSSTTAEAAALRPLKPGASIGSASQDADVGSIRLIGTLTVLERAAGSRHLPYRDEMRDLYSRLRGLDDGLPPLKDTPLMSLPCWRPS